MNRLWMPDRLEFGCMNTESWNVVFFLKGYSRREREQSIVCGIAQTDEDLPVADADRQTLESEMVSRFGLAYVSKSKRLHFQCLASGFVYSLRESIFNEWQSLIEITTISVLCLSSLFIEKPIN